MSSNTDSIIESLVVPRLEELKAVPARDPSRAASGRARFLREAAQHRRAISPVLPVRQSRWLFPIQKEKLALNALGVLILVAFLLLGGGATLATAQDDLPTEPLYQLKLWTEDATLALHGDPQEQADLLMNMAQTRVEEIGALTEMGITSPDQVRERLEKQLRQALILAADMDGSARDQVLLQLRDHLQAQDRILAQLETRAGTETEPLLDQTRQALQTDLRLVDEGLADPQAFRDKVKNQMQYGQDKKVPPEPNQQGGPDSHQNGANGQPSGGSGPGNGNGNNEGNSSPGNPTPGKPHNGNGGNGSDPNSPQGGNGSGPGNHGENGPGGGGGNK